MELNMKIRYLLLALYEYKYNGKLYEVGEVFASNGIKISPEECLEIAQTLQEDGLIKTLLIEDTIYAQILADGVEYLEDNNFFSGSSYLPLDRIKPLQREVFRNKLDEICILLQKLPIGDRIPAETLNWEMDELRNLLNILGKRSWLQIFKGKVLELTSGKATQEELNGLLRYFEAYPAVEVNKYSDFII